MGQTYGKKVFFFNSPSFRYNILAAKTVESAKNDKIAAKMLFDLVGLEAEKYRLGHTKVTKKLANKQWAKIGKKYNMNRKHHYFSLKGLNLMQSEEFFF